MKLEYPNHFYDEVLDDLAQEIERGSTLEKDPAEWLNYMNHEDLLRRISQTLYRISLGESNAD